MNRAFVVYAALVGVISFVGSAEAQGVRGPTPPSVTPGSASSAETGAADQIVKFGNYSALKDKRLSKDDKAKGKTLEVVLAEDKAAATVLAEKMKLSCTVSDAMRIAEGSETLDGSNVATTTYETSCGNGFGYFLVGRSAAVAPSAFSCFAADATRTRDIAEGRAPGVVCSLPSNADSKKMGSAILSVSGATCDVRAVRWIGQSAKSNADYTELACRDSGYVVVAPLPGSTTALKVVSCRDAYLQGIPCKLSDNGAPVVTLETFKEALTQHNVMCTGAEARLVGKESLKQRRVVEFKCSEYPAGLVAFIPLQGATAPFETVDCAKAATHGIECKLNK